MIGSDGDMETEAEPDQLVTRVLGPGPFSAFPSCGYIQSLGLTQGGGGQDSVGVQDESPQRGASVVWAKF